MSVPYTEISEVKKYLNQLHIVVSNEWIEACILFLKQEQGRPISLQNLQTSVHQQWLVADLEEIAYPCLPENLPTLQTITLNNDFALQVESIRDISKPAYSQLKQLEGSVNSNVEFSAAPKPYVPEWETKSNRMLLLNLTDGCTHIQGMEYRTITFLSPNLPPGVKVLIKGPVECKFGILLLTADKISILGGEVESKLQNNSREAVLRNILNLPAEGDNTESSPPVPSLSSDQSNQQITDQSNQQNRRVTERNVSTNVNNDQINDILDHFESDDDFEQNIDLGVIDEIENSQVQVINNANEVPDTCDIWNEDEDVLREMMEFQERNADFELCPTIPQEPTPKRPKKEPFTYLSVVLEEQPVNCTVTIKGFIVTALSKLECTASKGWSVMVKINDGTATLDAIIHDKVLENIIGVSAPEMMKKQLEAAQNRDKRLEVMEAISKCKLTLQNFSGLIDIKFSSSDKPCIVKFSEIGDEHIRQLYERVQSSF